MARMMWLAAHASAKLIGCQLISLHPCAVNKQNKHQQTTAKGTDGVVWLAYAHL
jgi:hypothetical protein